MQSSASIQERFLDQRIVESIAAELELEKRPMSENAHERLGRTARLLDRQPMSAGTRLHRPTRRRRHPAI
jgi:hypothetical protein